MVNNVKNILKIVFLIPQFLLTLIYLLIYSTINTHIFYKQMKAKAKYQIIFSSQSICVNTSNKLKLHFGYMQFGLGQWNRCWTKESDILNKLPKIRYLKIQ